MKSERNFLLIEVGRKPPEITAEIFPQDPLIAEARPDVGVKKITLPGEACLGIGPTSARVDVVDYDADLEELFEPARFRKDGTAFSIGRGRPTDNFKFHQVNVWAIITSTLNFLESDRIFGRRIPWAFDGARLLVHPHSGYDENAYYDRETGSLHFFYFEDKEGNPVYTCLSHDIVTHELGHAVLDGLKPYYNEVSSPDTSGFHEYFGDAVAMRAALNHPEIVREVVGQGERGLSGPNMIANIAAEFGRAMSSKTYPAISDNYLRSGVNKKSMAELEGVYEEHDYSEVLTGVYYDLLKAFYGKLLERQPYAKGALKKQEEVRVKAVMSAARIVSQLMFRALDYCPPVDLTYPDYARAVIRADSVAHANDPLGFRELTTNVFLKRGIIKKESELVRRFDIQNDQLRELDSDRLGASRTDAYRFVDANRKILRIPPEANLDVIHVYRTKKSATDEYRPPQELIVEFVWPESVLMRGAKYGDLSGERAQLWCGGTLVFDPDGNLLHYVLQENTRRRRKRLLEYLKYLIEHNYLSFAGEADAEKNVISARLEKGELRLARSAALRHQPRTGQKADGLKRPTDTVFDFRSQKRVVGNTPKNVSASTWPRLRTALHSAKR